ncbi:hypothetical protein ACFW04_014066 [Cataglyphis niger]
MLKQVLLNIFHIFLSYLWLDFNQLELDFNIDGCSLDKSGSIQIWPIQCRVANIQHAKPIVVGIYKGTHKSIDLNIFLEKFIADIRKIIYSGGINFHDNKTNMIKIFSKCKIFGIHHKNRYVFNGINHPLCTDEEYIMCLDEDHQKEGKSPLSMLPVGMVSQVLFEYIYLVCLGVMKNLLSAWIYGKYSRLSKLSERSICVQD